MLLFACSRYDAAADGGGHHYFTMGEAALHTQPVELVGDGIMHVGAADYRSVNNHIRPVRLVDTHNMYSPLLIEIENVPDDSLTVLIRFSYTHSSDTLLEVVSGTLNIPLVRDSFSLHHRLRLKGLPLYEGTPDKGTSQKVMLDLDYLLM